MASKNKSKEANGSIFQSGHVVHDNSQHHCLKEFIIRDDKQFVKGYQPKYFKRRPRDTLNFNNLDNVPEQNTLLTNRSGLTELTSRSSLNTTARSDFFDTSRQTTGRSITRRSSRSTIGSESTSRTGDFSTYREFDTSRTDLTIQVGKLEEERKQLEKMMAKIDARLMQSLSPNYNDQACGANASQQSQPLSSMRSQKKKSTSHFQNKIKGTPRLPSL